MEVSNHAPVFYRKAAPLNSPPQNITLLSAARLPNLNVGMKRHLLNGLLLAFLAACAMPSVRAQVTNQPPAPPRTNTVSREETERNWKLMEEYFAALARHNLTQAVELGQRSLTQATNDAIALNYLAWRIFNDRQIKHRDRKLAFTAAQRALELTRETDPEMLDTYARA